MHSEQESKKVQPMPDMLAFIFAAIAGNFVVNYLEDSYKTLYGIYKIENLLYIVAVGSFQLKLIWDLFIYYNDVSKRDPLLETSPFRFRLTLTIIELAIFVIGFRASVHTGDFYLSKKSGVFDISVIASFYEDVGLLELSWAIWCFVYLYIVVARQDRQLPLRQRIENAKEDKKDTVRWLVLNAIFSPVFLTLFSLENACKGQTSFHDAAFALGWTALYLITYWAWLRKYYAARTPTKTEVPAT